MRYVDIDHLEIPYGWQARADQALNELREEIVTAEVSTTAAGKDPEGIAKARRKAITEGTKKSDREKLWQDLALPLNKLTNGKCWYSESRNPASDKNVDHFRPKNAVAEDPSHEGYWWLAFNWQNYRYSSQWCNQRRIDKENKTSGGKSCHFPLRHNSFRARTEKDNIEQEDVVLLDPADPEDWKLLTFRSDGRPTPAKSPGTVECVRAEASITIYHLNCVELVRDRRPLAGKVQRLIEEMERLHPLITNPQERGFYKRQQKELLRLIQPHAEYSAAALAFARAEIYKLEQGHQVKRDWLEDILNTTI